MYLRQPILWQIFQTVNHQLIVNGRCFPYAVEDDLCMELIGKTRQMAVNKNKNHVWKNMTDMELLRSAGLYEKNLVTGQKVFKMTCFF